MLKPEDQLNKNVFYLDRAQNARIKATNWVMVVTREKKKEFEIRNEYAVGVK